MCCTSMSRVLNHGTGTSIGTSISTGASLHKARQWAAAQPCHSSPTAPNLKVAAALGALERLGLIHADIHAKNIMLVDHRAEPPAVKLIDFGTAVRSSDAEPAMSHQIYSYRSPEIILGLRFSPATDVWSLGVVMGLMVCGRQLFPGHGSYEVVSSDVQF